MSDLFGNHIVGFSRRWLKYEHFITKQLAGLTLMIEPNNFIEFYYFASLELFEF